MKLYMFRTLRLSIITQQWYVI